MLLTGCILVALVVLSFYLAYSDLLATRTYLGWILLAVFLIFFIRFADLWVTKLDNPFHMFFAVLLLALIFLSQGPLLSELISQSVLPDPSKGLKLIKDYSEAERKVAQDDYTGAILEYEKVIAKTPDDTVARFRLAELCYENEDYRKAAMAYEALVARARQLDMRQHCSALTRLADIYTNHLGDKESAKKHIRTIIETYPDTKYSGYAADRLANL